MKKQRFAVLLSTLVALAAAGILSKEVQDRIPTSLYKEYGYNKQGDNRSYVRVSKRATKYVTKAIGQTGPGTVDLVDSSLKQEVGVTNFRSNKMDIGNAFVFDKIWIKVFDDKNNQYPLLNGVRYTTILPEYLDGAEIEIHTDGKNIVTIPLGVTQSLENEDFCYELLSPGYLVDGATFEIKLKLPVSLPNGVYVRVYMDGIETVG